MSASNIVMNCDDLRNQIFSYAFHKIPEECEYCDCRNLDENPKLYLYKTTTFNYRGGFYKNSDDFENYLQSSNRPSVQTMSCYYCYECLKKVVCSEHQNLYTTNIYDEIKKRNPLMEHKKLKKTTEKYFDMVRNDDCNKKYRIKKTNELMILFHNMMIDVAKQAFKRKKEHDETYLITWIETIRDGFINIRKKNCCENSIKFVKEILTIKVSKLFYHKKINVNLFYVALDAIQNELHNNSGYRELQRLLSVVELKYRYRYANEELPVSFVKEFYY